MTTPDERSAAALHDAVHGLYERTPEYSAAVAFTRPQKIAFLTLLGIVVAGVVLARSTTLVLISGFFVTWYAATLADRFIMFRRGLNADAILQVSDADAHALSADELPPYTVLVPAYGEPEVVGQLIGAVRSIDYPAEKLQVLLLLEQDDTPTIAAAEESLARDPEGAEVVTVLHVPPAEPRTKPKACNYGLHYATGEIVTIYDAEDTPDPLQLRRVVAAFRRLDAETGAASGAASEARTVCIQARLSYRNARQNMLTAWFTIEYDVWFKLMLPGIMRMRAPVPLGGTSNHFRRGVLRELGAWDPYNVTEDADLGVRIAAHGYRTAVLDSETLEEANSDTINWLRQRSRWYKGYLQTWLVYMRRPDRLLREIGFIPALRFTLLMASTPIIAVVNLVFWYLFLLWIMGQPDFVAELFPPAVFYPSLVCLVAGNALTVYMNLVGVREGRDPLLILAVLTYPAYWLLMSIAAAKGMWQLLFRPSYWEKTAHGLEE
ncbi:glycosyltransferase [Corynebacterium variabile]|uniref:Glycosyltransferases, probably involved in cell wall biogenesis n=1 Tax=Corynebacterium variabile TaxID=1727 RepID=A0A0X2NNF3_9CORY|nr:glycosyltransferase [Corynebacterium variabile]GEC87151.1 N-acetylglucosaminyltransferase [Corynebacterium variabile]CUU66298.1 Glycosyltransferases, probably involved in cell wall biogenesis [Corynebacterium variabile]